jgi:acyl-CoA reductase-like NAD-dependent aldehyde dehydrogenase
VTAGPGDRNFRQLTSSLSFPTLAFIDGTFREAVSGARFVTSDPSSGASIAEVAACDAADVDLAVVAARRSFAQGGWSRATPERRKAVLLKLAELVEEHSVELATLESWDSGKTITDCLNEIGTEVPTIFRWYAELADKTFGKVAPTGEHAFAFIIQEPVGVAGLVVPWNFPLLMATWKLAPALAAGCSVVLKPAEQTPLTALRLAQLAADAGLPEGVLNVLPGYGHTAGQAIGRHRGIDVVSFTGSNEVGAYFLKYSSESNLKPVGLEMGGKSPFIVLDDAELSDDLIHNATMAAFWNAGQNCSANMRQIVDAKLKDEFIAKVLAKIKTLRIGDPLDQATQMGALVSEEQKRRVLDYIASGRAEGAVQLSGSDDAESAGYFVTPTLFDGVTSRMKIAREEIFGPVLGVMSVNGLDEALKVACDTDYGLHATVYTQDLDRALYLARRLPCGTVAINGFTEGDVKTPFGGYQRSGSFARDKGTEALAQYMQTKTVWMSLKAPR